MCYIYTITSLKKYDGERLIYVGSTTDWEKRFADHKYACFNPNSSGYNCKLYKLIREYGWNEFVFEVVEVLDDDTTDKELLFREQFYIDKYNSKSSMNTHDAIIGIDMVEYYRLYHAEYYKIHREKINARNKEWYNNNRERMTALNREWIENNRDRHREIDRNSRRKKRLWKNALADMSRIEPSFFC